MRRGGFLESAAKPSAWFYDFLSGVAEDQSDWRRKGAPSLGLRLPFVCAFFVSRVQLCFAAGFDSLIRIGAIRGLQSMESG